MRVLDEMLGFLPRPSSFEDAPSVVNFLIMIPIVSLGIKFFGEFFFYTSPFGCDEIISSLSFCGSSVVFPMIATHLEYLDG